MQEAIHDALGNDDESVEYVYLVHGVVPEFMPHVSFRREKHFKTAGRKIIKCPYCRNTFTTIDADEKIELCCHSKAANVLYHDSMRCKTCHNLVGIIYAA